MMTSTSFCARAAGFALASVASVACGNGDSDNGPAEPMTGAAFVIANEIYDDTGSTSYLNIIDSLDTTVVDTSQAIEIAGGRATIASHGGYLFVAPPDTPVIRRYKVDAGNTLVEDGEVSFANYGLESIWIDE